jgi:hypothetical protein
MTKALWIKNDHNQSDLDYEEQARSKTRMLEAHCMIETETSMEGGDDHKKSVTKDTTIYQHELPKDTSQHIETQPVTNSATTLGDEVTYSNVDMPS